MIALRRSKVQTQRDVLVGKSPAILLNVNATRMSQEFAGSSYIQQMVLGEVNEFVQRYRGSVNGEYGPHGKVFGFSSRRNGFFNVELLPDNYKLTLMVHTQESNRGAKSEPVSVELKVEPGETYYFVAKLDMPQSIFKLVVDKTKKNKILDEGPFPLSVFVVGSVRGSGRGGLSQEQSWEIIRSTLPPPSPPPRR